MYPFTPNITNWTAPDATGISNITNVGGGAGVLQNISGGVADLRTIIGGGASIVTENASTISIYSPVNTITSLPGGTALVASNLPGATIKSLVPGSNITISNDANTVTINSNIVATNTVTNLGGGSEVLVDVLAGSIRARTLVGQGSMAINQSGSTITLSASTVAPVVASYQYMSSVTVDYSAFYQSGILLSSSTVQPIQAESQGVITVLSPTAFSFTPCPRQKSPVTIMVQLNFGTVFNTLTVVLTPVLTMAADTTRDLLLGASSTTGQIYQINNNTLTETLLTNYDGTAIDFLVPIQAMSVDMDDNIMFYVLTTSNTTLRAYDFVTKLSSVVLSPLTSGGWTPGAVISAITFDQNNHDLYILGDLNASVVMKVSITPFDRSVGLIVGSTSVYASPFVSGASNVQQCITVDPISKTIYGIVFTSGGLLICRQLNILGGVATSIGSITLGFNTIGDNIIAASGRLYIFTSPDNNLVRTTAGQGISGTTTTRLLTYTYNTLCRSFYGKLM